MTDGTITDVWQGPKYAFDLVQQVENTYTLSSQFDQHVLKQLPK